MDVNCYNYINLDYLEMMSDGDESMKKIMLEMLLEELPVEINKMENCAQEANWKELGSISHKLKSTLAFVGNDEMTNANKSIESITKSCENTAEVPALLQTLKTLCPITIAELNQELLKL